MGDLKYVLKAYPQDRYKFKLFDNVNRLEYPEIIRRTPGCVDIINTAYFALTDLPGGIDAYDHQSALMIDGKWLCRPKWHEYGICIDQNGTLTLGTEDDAKCDYAVGLPPAVINGKSYNDKHWGKNGVSYAGLTEDGTVVCMLSTKDDGMLSSEAVEVMRDAGCIHIFRWDGSWSARGRIGGVDVVPSQHRDVRTWMLIIDKNKEGKPVRKKVCIDPGHGPGSSNCSPDKSYWEYEFAWDLYKRMVPLLERCGIDVVVTRDENTKPELDYRCAISNRAKADLFVSLHSNAVGAGQWVSDAEGLMAYTSVAGNDAPRNRAARMILQRMRDAGVTVRSNGLLHDSSLTVLRKTDAPAVLLEYGFHTNKNDVALLKSVAYRDKLATATVRGICDFLNVVFVGTTPQEPEPAPEPWYAEAQRWAKENGIADGTRPEDSTTRAEVWEMLRRLAEKKG